jgi:hypothetical protein
MKARLHAQAELPDAEIFKPKMSIWVYVGGSCNGKFWYILWRLGPIYGHLVYFVVI